MSVRLHFLRHGQTPNSRDNVFCGSGLDPELTADGVGMALAFAQAYGDRAWKAIYSGPLRRTMSTATTIAQRTTLPVTVRDGLVEIA